MKDFRFFGPTAVEFGVGKLDKLGELTAPLGARVMLVTVPWEEPLVEMFERAEHSLREARLDVLLFPQVQPNPTVETVDAGGHFAREEGVEVVIGMGGGSSMDTAKGIAVAATHPHPVWDYMYFQDAQPDYRTLPIVAVTTTSGTGSHVTKVAVLTKTDEACKSAIASDMVFPEVAVVDPALMTGLPRGITASTTFDAYTHAFESYINPGGSPMTDLLALESLRLLADNGLPVLDNGTEVELRSNLAWADTLAGWCIANAGTTLPHAMGQPISGHFPHVSHGQSLAIVYPAFLEYTCEASPERFIAAGKLFDSSVRDCEGAVGAMVKWMTELGMKLTLSDVGITEEQLAPVLADCMAFPDVGCNPRVPCAEEVMAMYKQVLK
jgi:alcohol dehydrogenase class IV